MFYWIKAVADPQGFTTSSGVPDMWLADLSVFQRTWLVGEEDKGCRKEKLGEVGLLTLCGRGHRRGLIRRCWVNLDLTDGRYSSAIRGTGRSQLFKVHTNISTHLNNYMAPTYPLCYSWSTSLLFVFVLMTLLAARALKDLGWEIILMRRHESGFTYWPIYALTHIHVHRILRQHEDHTCRLEETTEECRKTAWKDTTITHAHAWKRVIFYTDHLRSHQTR